MSSTKSRSQSSNKQVLVIAAAVAAVVALLAIIAVVASGGDDDDAAADQPVGSGETQPAEITGGPLAVLVGLPADDPVVGTPGPTVVGRTFDGEEFAIETDQPTLLIFLAHWCPVCQGEVPEITQWAADGGVPDDVQVIGIATSTSPDRPNYPPSAWLQREDFPFPVIADTADSDIAAAYGLPAYPYYVLIDADGNIAHRGSGQLGASELSALLDTVS